MQKIKKEDKNVGIKRTAHVVIKLKEGGTLALDGDPAVGALLAFEKYGHGEIASGFWYDNEDGNREFMRFACTCGLEVLPQTEEEIDDPVCDPMDCIEPYPPAE